MSTNPFPQSYGPFSGMRFCPDSGRRFPDKAYYAKNMFVTDPVNKGPYVRRVAEAAFAGGGTLFQWIGIYRKNGGFRSVSVQNGEIYTWESGAWTRRVTTANFTTKSITVSATARIFATTYNNTIVFNDGVNQPFTWEGTAGTSGLVLLTNAPTKCYGKPTVYYGKLFFIKDVAANAADRSTIVWSEENAANTGYEASGYVNVWSLNQNGAGALAAIVATNSGLYYFRPESIGVIRGAVTPQFVTSGVHDGVSGRVGSTCPDVQYYDSYLYFFDLSGKPLRIQEGGEPEDLWEQMADIWAGPDIVGGTYNPAFWSNTSSYIAVFPWYNGVVFGSYSAASGSLVMWAFSHQTGGLQCELVPASGATAYTVILLGEMYDEANFRTVIAFGTATTSVIMPLQTPSGGYGYYPAADNVTRQLILGAFGSGDEAQWQFTRLAVQLVVGKAAFASVLSLAGYYSPSENPGGSLTRIVDASSTDLLKTATHSVSMQTQKRVAWGIQSNLRWTMAAILEDATTSSTGEGWGVYSATMLASPTPITPDKT